MFLTQDTQEDAVEGAHPQHTGIVLTYNACNAVFHFACRLVGEGQCKDGPRLVAMFHEVCNLIGEHAGLS